MVGCQGGAIKGCPVLSRACPLTVCLGFSGRYLTNGQWLRACQARFKVELLLSGTLGTNGIWAVSGVRRRWHCVKSRGAVKFLTFSD